MTRVFVDTGAWYGIQEAVSFDADFAVYRYGPGLGRAFTVYR